MSDGYDTLFMKALFLLEGAVTFDDLIDKTEFPSATTKPTKEECLAALVYVLRGAGNEMYIRGEARCAGDPDELVSHPDWSRALVLWALANCFDPASRHKRVAEIKNRGKGYETDEARDSSIARLVQRLRKTWGPKRATSEVAALIGRHPRSIREARKRVAKRLKEDLRKEREES